MQMILKELISGEISFPGYQMVSWVIRKIGNIPTWKKH
jgi:hypothetical protein